MKRRVNRPSSFERELAFSRIAIIIFDKGFIRMEALRFDSSPSIKGVEFDWSGSILKG